MYVLLTVGDALTTNVLIRLADPLRILSRFYSNMKCDCDVHAAESLSTGLSLLFIALVGRKRDRHL